MNIAIRKLAMLEKSLLEREEAAKFDWSTCKVITKSGAVQGATFRQIVDILANNQEFLKLY